MRGGLIVGRLCAAVVAVLALGVFAVSPASAADGDTLEIDLEGLNGYDFDGTAVITEENGSITVEIEVSGDDVVGGHPVHIHLGTCNALDPNPTYPLADIDEDGQSSSPPTEGVTIDDLLSEPYAINAHLSATEIPIYTTCGDIVAASDGGDGGDGGDEAAAGDDGDEDEDAADEAAADDDEDDAAASGVGGGTTVTTAPSTGVGSALAQSQAGMTAFLTVVGSLAAVLLAAGISLRYREARARS